MVDEHAASPPPLSPDPYAALRRLVEDRLDFRSRLTDLFLPRLLGRGVAAVVHYGSCLTGTAASDSEPDFYVVVDQPRRYHRHLFDLALGELLPPSIYHPTANDGDHERRCKLCVITARQLARETSPGASDLYHLGRFSKRLGLVYARDGAARRAIVEAHCSSLRVLTPWALARLGPRFTLGEFARTLLGLSYAAETRIAEPTKASALYAADQPYFAHAAALALAGETRRRGTPTFGGNTYRQVPSPHARLELERWLARSRRRSALRAAKHLFTFDGWLDYLLAKLERHHDIHLDLRPRERRLPLLYAWPRLVTLYRTGIVG